MLAGMVRSQHASHLAIMLRDWSVLFLCRDQLRKEAYLHRVQDILDQTYCWTKPLDHAMTRGDLRLSCAPPSAILLRQFPRRMELCCDEDSKNNERLWYVRWQAMIDCMCEGLHTFEKEIQEWVNFYDSNYGMIAPHMFNEAWMWYYHDNQNKVRNCMKNLNAKNVQASIWSD